jgi:hypothetical protein
MGFTRKLEEVGQALDSIVTQKDLTQFLNGTGNAQKLNKLVEDICDALMEYQVCTPKSLALIISDTTPDLLTARSLR